MLADVFFDSVQFRINLSPKEKTQVKAFINLALKDLGKYELKSTEFSVGDGSLYLEFVEGDEPNKPIMSVVVRNDDKNVRSYAVFTEMNEKYIARCRIEERIERNNYG